MLDLIDMLNCFGFLFHNDNWSYFFWRGIPKIQLSGSFSNAKKNNCIFGGRFFAKLQSVAISQWSLRFFALSSLFKKKKMKATAAIKKCTKQVWVIRSHSKLLANYSADVNACVPRQATHPTPWVTYRWARTHSIGTDEPTYVHVPWAATLC